MAISVDKVYQKVLALANKEQRGYITPQEFNLFADHAQMDIFEQYFYDLEQRQRGTGNEFDYADIVTNIEEKISMFEVHNKIVTPLTDGTAYIDAAFPDFYRLGTVNVTYSDTVAHTADQIQLNQINKYQNSPLAAPSKSNPVYTEFSTTNDPINNMVYPSSGGVTIDYIRKPLTPNWTYIISSTGNALYNANAQTRDFDLHPSEENNLVIKILQLAGITLKDLNLVQAVAQEEIKSIQQQKQ